MKFCIVFLVVLATLQSCVQLVAGLEEEAPKSIYYDTKLPKDAEKKYVALTFDDGPHQHLTPRLLDILKEKNGAKATFYVMGVKAIIHPEILARAVEEGSEVANHVWDHPVLTKINKEELNSQLSRTTDAIKNAVSSVDDKHKVMNNGAPRTMRPPYGLTNKKNNADIFEKHNMDVVIWSLDTVDWKFPKPDELVKGVMKKVKNGDIILCHDIHANTIESMPGLIDALQKENFELITVSELVKKQHQQDKRRLRGSLA